MGEKIKYVAAEIDKRVNKYEKGIKALESEYYNVSVTIDNIPHLVSYVVSWQCNSLNFVTDIDEVITEDRCKVKLSNKEEKYLLELIDDIL